MQTTRALKQRDLTDTQHSVVIRASVSTSSSSTAAAAADDDDASECDVIAPHPEHLLLISMGSCSTTKLVL